MHIKSGIGKEGLIGVSGSEGVVWREGGRNGGI